MTVARDEPPAVEPESERTDAVPVEPEKPADPLWAFADLDALSTREKLRRFT